MRRVQVTPLLGTQTGGAVCSLLEIDQYRILLDCGYDKSCCKREQIQALINRLDYVDAVLISHGDTHHMGALPLVFGNYPVPIICTLPVFKFGRMMLYDLFMNTEMEGNKQEQENMFTLDEIDISLTSIHTVKYNQSLQFPLHTNADGEAPVNPLTLTAYPSGRTIGGSVWCIKCGAISITYAVDINLKKDYVLDAINIQALPSSPNLLILEGGYEARVIGETSSKKQRGGRDKESSGLIDAIMETVRGDGHVLIPCETAARTLEILFMLDKHWRDNKIGLYSLVLLSHMASHIVDYARSQLEWMRDSLSKGFYNEKPNPFQLSHVTALCSLKDFASLPPGPKVVLCPEASLNCGLAKDLLLKWSSDPKNRVLFPDYPDRTSLAFTLLSQSFSPPVIVSVTHPERVMLSGEELLRHMERINREEREREEEMQRDKLQEELLKLASAKQEIGDGDEDEDDLDVLSDYTAAQGGKKRAVKKAANIAKYARPSFPMFESRESVRAVDEYGMSIDDLDFSVANTATAARRSTVASTTPAVGKIDPKAKENEPVKMKQKSVFPTKIISKTSKVQFTCDFKVVAVMNGRAERKAIKNLINQVLPKRVLILRPGQADVKMVAELKDSDIHGKDRSFHLAKVNAAVSFEDRAETIKILIPQSLLPPSMTIVRGPGGASCSVFTINGSAVALNHSQADGVRLLKFIGVQQESQRAALTAAAVIEAEVAAADEPDGDIEIKPVSEEEEFVAETSLLTEFEASEKKEEVTQGALNFKTIGLGTLSLGEVQLKTVKEALEASGISAEYRLASSGSILVCGNQVIIRKDNENDFVLEGPPTSVYFEARKILYGQFALI